MKIAFHGAARNVTGSKHLLTLNNGTQVLLDCGMFQGMGKETDELNRSFGFAPHNVDCMVLSHAHIDHCGLIPRLVAEGFKGSIFCTGATRDLAEILLYDSAKIQASDAKFINKRRLANNQNPIEPLYTDKDVSAALKFFKTVEYDRPTQIGDGLEVLFTDSGHIIGSAAVSLKIAEEGKVTHLTFSGDVGRYGDLILKSPQPFPQADYVIIESTYGDTLHKDAESAEDALLKVITETCINRGGKVIIPAFSVGRTQELLYILNGLELQGRLPAIPYYVDSPLSEKATMVVKHHPEGFNNQVQEVLKVDEDPFDFKGLHYVEDSEESKALNSNPEPCVIISASGMAEAGRIKHHIKNNISDEKNTIMLVGYCEPNSLGGRLKAGYTEVSIFGEHYPVKAEVRSIRSMSAHGDYEDLIQFLSTQNTSLVKKVFLVHGEYDVQLNFREKLLTVGFNGVEIPDKHQEFYL